MPNDSPPSEPQRTILQFLEQCAGGKSMVTLREGDSVPVLKPLEGLRQTGKYQLQGEIARGGVGVVIKGHDTHLGRDVALKMVREEYADHAEVTQRFVEEAQIGGQLQHPGIVPVYDIGLHEGRPFFTMKLIKGRTLAALLEEKGESRRRLLTIFEAVCQTMAYAHSRGVIHRDLKPANVMVGAFGEVQVVDWGMGKVLKSGGVEDERRAARSQDTIVATLRSAPGSVGSQSLVGSVMGTPGYMPPEQAMGDVEHMDERSDVFSLGAILVEILTGRPPYTGSNQEVIVRAARGDLAECLERIAACDADDELKALARSCLMPARQARPRNAGELAQHVGAYLAALEEKARAAQVEAAEERIRGVEAKRKQKLTLALAASVLLTAGVGGGGLWWVNGQKAAREARLREQLQAALLDASRADDATDALSAAARARDLLAQSDAAPPPSSVAELERVESRARATQQRARIVRENAALLAELERVRGPRAEDERFSVDWGTTDRGYAAAFSRLSLAPDEGTVEGAAAALSTRGDDLALAAALDDWTSIRREMGATAGAKRLTEVASRLDGDRARGGLRAALLSGDVETLEKLARDADVSAMEPRTLQLLGQALMELGRGSAARAFLLRAHDAHPDSFLVALYLARAYFLEAGGVRGAPMLPSLQFHLVARALRPDDYIANVELAQQYLNAQQHDRAEQLFRDLIAARPTDAVLLGELALVMKESGRAEEAESQFRAALRLDPEAVWVRRQLGHLLLERGRPDEAIVEFERVIGSHPKLASAHLGLGVARASQGRRAEACAALRHAAESCPSNAVTLANIGWWQSDQGDHVAALSTLRRAVDVDPSLARAHLDLGLTLQWMGDNDAAIVALRRAIALEQDPKGRASAQALVGEVLRIKGDLEGAIVEIEQAIAQDPGCASAYAGLASVRLRQKRHPEARDGARRALELGRGDASVLTEAGGILSDLGDLAEALSILRRAVEIDPKRARPHTFLAITLGKMGDADGSILALRRSIELERDPEALASRRVTLGDTLLARGDLEGAIVEFEKAIEEDPKLALAHLGLASARARQGRLPEAREGIRRAIELAPEDAAALTGAGGSLSDMGDLVEALSTLRRAIEVDPKSGRAHRFLGITLRKSGDLEGAIAALRRALALPQDPAGQTTTYVLLGESLLATGDLDGATAAFRSALETDPQSAPARGGLAMAEQVAALSMRLPGVLAGTDQPSDWREALAFAEMAARQGKDPVGALRLYRQAFEANPGIASDSRNAQRYNAACVAVLVGKAEHAQALVWLRADLDALKSLPAADAGWVLAQLEHWKRDPDLGAIRDIDGLTEDFRKLWIDVDALLERARK